MFSIGDKVICIYKDIFDSNNIVIGKEYTIDFVRENIINKNINVYTLKEIRGAYDDYYFKLSIKTIRKEKLKKLNNESICGG